MSWSKKQKAFTICAYYRTNSYLDAQAQFRQQYPEERRKFPHVNTIKYWVKRFKKDGCVPSSENQRKVSPSVRTQENIETLRKSVDETPKTSVRHRSQHLGFSPTSCWRMLRKDLKLLPYRSPVKHELTQVDIRKRYLMCDWFNGKVRENPAFLNDVWFTDECHFHLSGYVNSKNQVFWGSEKPDFCLQRPIHSIKCTAWMAISKHGLIGPFWFEDADGKALTVNKDRYLQVLVKFWNTLGRRNDLSREDQWIQQDGAPPHTARETIAWLEQHFGDQVISRLTEHEWAPHSPDLTPPDFFLWAYLKSNVYKNNPTTIRELKVAVKAEVRQISRDVCSRVIDNFYRRIQLCRRRGGSHIEHLQEFN